MYTYTYTLYIGFVVPNTENRVLYEVAETPRMLYPHGFSPQRPLRSG